MKKESLIVEIDDQEACLSYDTDTWMLSLGYIWSHQTVFELSMDNIKKIYISSTFQTTHTEDKNKLARTIIGGALFGAAGAIIGAVSGEGSKQVTDAKYSCIHIETHDGREFVIVCKENGIFNNSRFFIQGVQDAVLSKNDEGYRKRKKIGTALAIICLVLFVVAIIVTNLDL
jgi:hypothetical protein